jgi:2-C-methyl-D-erythritol 4-phosphate cytidylyltransferase
MVGLKRYALIVAGGSGSRMNAPVAKQFLLLNNLPILMHTLNRFYQYDPIIELILVLPEEQFDYWKTLCITFHFSLKHQLIAGGEVRFESVKKGLSSITGEGIVAIHDGVRPFVSIDTIERCIKMAEEKGNAIPVMPVVESLRKVDENINHAVDRSSYVNIQTPQVFRVSEIKQAYELGFDTVFTDDATVLERMGKQINLVEGNLENIKITHPTDLVIAKSLIEYLGIKC